MLKSLRYRLLAWFLAFVLLTAALIVPVNLIYQSREKSIGLVSRQISSLHIDFLKDTKAVNDFLTTEPSNTDFFAKGNNSYLSYHISKSAGILADLDKIRNSGLVRDFGISNQLDGLKANLKHYNLLLDSLVYLVYKRGYRNFGLEGELYNYGSLLESAHGLPNSDVYRLRKIENDYFFNHDTASVAKFSRIAAGLKKTVPDNGNTAGLIDSYEEAFLRLVDLDSQTGIRKNIALKAQLNKQSSDIEDIFTRVTEKTSTMQEAMLDRLTRFYILSLIFILILSVFFSYAASRHIVSHLEALTNYISVLSSSRQDHSQPIDLSNSAREIKQIYREFRNLFSMLKVWEKQRDKAIRSAEDTQQRYQELADMLPQSVFETDAMGNYTYANKAWHKAFGYTLTDIREGLNLIETLIPESQQENILDPGKIENSTFLAIRKDGRQFPVSVYSDNIVKDGRMDGRRGIIIDITDKINYIKSLQQETSKARTSDELKSSFLANMSHEIRTPMNSIIGFSNLLASEHIPDIQKKDFVHYIRTSSEILLNLVDDIIDIAKIEAGELKIVKKECEIYSLGQELLTMSQEVKKKFNKHEIDLVYFPEPGRQELFMKTDPFRLRQILINLITNAIKFTEKGSVEFGFSVKDERNLEFYVKDTGVGLTRSELDLIFERFKRTRRSEEKNIVGTGLGLAISRNLVQLMGGEMWVDSVPGGGTTFTFTLPYLKITRLPDRVENPGRQPRAYNWTGAGILIVEDDPVSHAFLKELFRQTGADLYHAGNGLEAVSQFRKIKNIDLVIMDIQMPEMDGFEATRIIRSLNDNIPVIAQTAFAMSDDKEKMKQAGFDDYVSKPIDINQLLAIVHRWITRSKTRVQPKLSGVLSPPPPPDPTFFGN